MTNRSDDSQLIPRLGGETAAEYTDETSTAAPGTEPKIYVSPPAPDDAHALVHRVLDVIAQPGNRGLIKELHFEMRGDGTYFLSLETK